MSKELTEKWKNGKLTFGKMYWCCDKEKNIAKLVNINKKFFEWDIATDVTKDVKEVLAPVPNYEEFVQQRDFVKDHQKVLIENMNLKLKLEIATKALEELELKSDKFYRGGNDWSLVEQLDFIKAKCQETLYHLKEMEGVK